MLPRERAVMTLNLGIPDRVPTFELVVHETASRFQGRVFYRTKPFPYAPDNYEDEIRHNAGLYYDIAEYYEHDIIFLGASDPKKMQDPVTTFILTMQAIRDLGGSKFMILAHGDATFSVPSGEKMLEFAYKLSDDPQGLKDQAARMVEEQLKNCSKMMQAGMDGFILCSDYALNAGPFLSPEQFSEFVAPYLKLLVSEQRAMGAYVIKHTDGNIMPIFEQILAAKPHAIHSLDPMAGMDIRHIKKLYGDRVALCGNINCALLQSGSSAQILESAKYCLQSCKPGGGYFYTTSNSVYHGMPIENYELIHSYLKQHRNY